MENQNIAKKRSSKNYFLDDLFLYAELSELLK
jgi:hypothetical protein